MLYRMVIMQQQGSHCPGNQGKVRESEKGLKLSGKV